jgi:hypothetical protein
MSFRISPPKGLFFLFVLAALGWWVRYHPPGADLIVFDDDARQHVYWTARFQDSELFPDDLLTEFISSPLLDPIGYQAVYWVGTRWMDPLTFSQVLTLVLLFISLWLFFLLVKPYADNSAARLFCSGIFLFYVLYDASGGFPRSFAFPLLLAFLVLLQRGRFRWAVAILLLQALLYPPIFLNTLMLVGCDLLGRARDGLRHRKWWGDILWTVLVTALAAGYLLSVYEGKDKLTFGPKVTLKEAKQMPEFYPGGRSVFFRETLPAYLLLGRSGIDVLHLIGLAIILIFLLAAGWGTRRFRLPRLAGRLLWTSLLLFTAAHLLLFRLHLPSRYTLYTLPISLLLCIASAAGPFLETLKRIWLRWFPRGAASTAWALFIALILAYTWLQGHYFVYLDPLLVTVDQEERELMEFLRTLPKGALVAGHPLDMDDVPLLARRKVLANRELSIPYYLGYYRQIRGRLLDLFRAYYAPDWGTVEAFVQRYGIRALVVNRDYFDPRFLRGPVYHEPFDSTVRDRIREGGKFALTSPPEKLIGFRNTRYIVLCFDSNTESASCPQRLRQ